MASIRIIALSAQVKLPDWLKQEFKGLIFPVSAVPVSQMPLSVCGVNGSPAAVPEVIPVQYFVKGTVVLDILELKNFQAAKWLWENTAISSPGSWVGFSPEECAVIKQ